MRLESKLEIETKKAEDWAVDISEHPLIIGSYIHYEITFRDGLKWFIRIHRNEHQLSEADEVTVDNKYRAIIHVRGKTEQVFSAIAHTYPDVHGWETSMYKIRHT